MMCFATAHANRTFEPAASPSIARQQQSEEEPVRRSISARHPGEIATEMSISPSMRAWRRRRLVGDWNRR
jgi:hypothetical protein